jgi:ribonuclease P protein component
VRLARTGEFQKLKREGTSLHGKFIVLSVLRSATHFGRAIGLITSRRVGGAVVRNRVPRRLREIVRADRGRLVPIAGSC